MIYTEIYILFCYFTVVDGSSKESEKLINESWSSFLLVALLGVALTILIIGAVVILLARMNNASVQQRRRRRDAAAAATVAGNHQFPGNHGKFTESQFRIKKL